MGLVDLKPPMRIPKMTLLGTRGTGGVRILRVLCPCGNVFDHRDDKEKMRCQMCGRIGNCIDMSIDFPVKRRRP